MLLHNYYLEMVIAVLVCCTGCGLQDSRQVRELDALLTRVGGEAVSGRVEFQIIDYSADAGEATKAGEAEETFTIGPNAEGDKPLICGTSVSAASAGLGWYLNHYVHRNISWNNLTQDMSADIFPVPDSVETRSAGHQMRYCFNYCTFSYSMAFWDWERWQQEIDYLALHGVNMPLMLVGTDCVWKSALEECGYDKESINRFIAGPGFQAWWLMGNLEGWGGPNPDWWYERQEQLCHQILGRMRALGMKPVLPGYSGMVPRDAGEKLGLKIDDPGTWCRTFNRPAFLLPDSEDFAQMASLYYRHLEKIMGTSDYYSMDLFHEGGDISRIDLKAAYAAVNDALHKAVPGSRWVLQCWGSNPRKEALEAVPKGDFIILDLFSDGDPKWMKGFDGHNYMYCMLHNFGGRTGLHGRLECTMKGYFDALDADSGTLYGIGATPEGICTNGILYDALFELPWMKREECDSWLRRYIEARYGSITPDVDSAWQIICRTALACPTSQQGTSEPVVCASPSFDVSHVSSWSTCRLYYDPAQLVEALNYMEKASEQFKGNGNFDFDLCDLRRQVITDSCQIILSQAHQAFLTGNRRAYDVASEQFLNNILRLDSMLTDVPILSYNYHSAMARRICDEVAGASDSDRDWMEWNLHTQVTTWSRKEDAAKSGLLDYSNREWSGLLRDYYYPRWETFFETNRP